MAARHTSIAMVTVTAFVTLKPEQSLTEAELIDFCRQHLAGYKAPKAVHILPLTTSGKILKR